MKKLSLFILIFLTAECVLGRSPTPDNKKTIDNIGLLDESNSYSVDDNGNVTVSYHNGKDKSKVPLASEIKEYEAAFYVSEEKTAIAYRNGEEESQIQVLTSDNMGKTWNPHSVLGESVYSPEFIGFTTQNDGYLVTVSGPAMGNEKNHIFLTSDGGKTWHEIGNTNEVYPRVVTGAFFINDKIGFLSFRYDGYDTPDPVLLHTDDAGKTWTKCDILIPDIYKSTTDYATALSPVFNGKNGVLPVRLQNNNGNGDPIYTLIHYISSDYGKTWKFVSDDIE
ncbi:MAG: hypothetical protein E7205_05540 [Tissierellaceae bacterium]|nr:hypothetical protein [Tissierellaceae bacterium]